MTRSTLTRIAATGFATSIAGLALAVPATAMEPGDPGGGRIAPVGGSTTTTSSDDPWTEIAIGALGGLALAGAGVAAATAVRHRHAVSAT